MQCNWSEEAAKSDPMKQQTADSTAEQMLVSESVSQLNHEPPIHDPMTKTTNFRDKREKTER
jgi:hypothetical protein